jgi:hypothetical protein
VQFSRLGLACASDRRLKYVFVPTQPNKRYEVVYGAAVDFPDDDRTYLLRNNEAIGEDAVRISRMILETFREAALIPEPDVGISFLTGMDMVETTFMLHGFREVRQALLDDCTNDPAPVAAKAATSVAFPAAFDSLNAKKTCTADDRLAHCYLDFSRYYRPIYVMYQADIRFAVIAFAREQINFDTTHATLSAVLAFLGSTSWPDIRRDYAASVKAVANAEPGRTNFVWMRNGQLDYSGGFIKTQKFAKRYKDGELRMECVVGFAPKGYDCRIAFTRR